jgi:CUB domain
VPTGAATGRITVAGVNNTAISSSGFSVRACGSTILTAASGAFSDGSGESEYENGLSCNWLIRPPIGTTLIHLTFSEFSLAADGSDMVSVYDGENAWAPLLGRFWGNSLPPVLTATSGAMFLVFETNGWTTGPGWSASYTSNNLPVTRITWFSPFSGMVGESVTINGANLTGATAVSFNNIPASFTINSATQIRTTIPAGATTGRIRVVGANNTAVSSTDFRVNLCGNATLTAASGTISDGSEPGSYENGLSCSWLIQPPGASPVTLTFTRFATESWYDQVRIYDGSTTAAPLLGSYSGWSLPPALTANSGRMFITFTTDGSVVGDGWSANYT